MEQEYNHGISRMVTLKYLESGRAVTAFAGVVICRADRGDIAGFQDLEGKTFSAPAATSLGGWYSV